jgi:hypothetical protein
MVYGSRLLGGLIKDGGGWKKDYREKPDEEDLKSTGFEFRLL